MGLELPCLPRPEKEISFGGDGESFCIPKQADHCFFHSVPIYGQIVCPNAVDGARRELRDRGFAPGSYSIQEGFCCVTYVRQLCDLLGLVGFPHYVTRGADAASYCMFLPLTPSNMTSSNGSGSCNTHCSDEEMESSCDEMVQERQPPYQTVQQPTRQTVRQSMYQPVQVLAYETLQQPTYQTVQQSMHQPVQTTLGATSVYFEAHMD